MHYVMNMHRVITVSLNTACQVYFAMIVSKCNNLLQNVAIFITHVGADYYYY